MPPEAVERAYLPPASGILCYLLLLVGAALLFGLWPEIDMKVSALARELSGGQFQQADGWWWWLYAGMRPLVVATLAVFAIVGIGGLLRRRPLFGVTPARCLFVVTSFLLIQGVVVELYLKRAFGRARPREVVEFGGSHDFTPFYWVSDACSRNCSFPSGHAAMAFAFFALLWVVPRPWTARVFWAVALFGAVSGWMRIVQGAHFLSDVVFSGLVVFGCTWLLALLLRWWETRESGRSASGVASL